MSLPTWTEDLAFLNRHRSITMLSDPDGPGRVAVCAELQGRVLTSSPRGDHGPSLGWINRPLFASGEPQPHIHAYGGEDRFWLGPEGGQFSIFFPPDVPFDLAHWQTPAPIDTQPYPQVAGDEQSAAFRAEFSVTNRAGFVFPVRVDRTVSIISRTRAGEVLGVPVPEPVDLVGFASENRITNLGDEAWVPRTGLLSVWILGMFHPSPGTVVVIPIRAGDPSALGPPVHDAYFGPIPSDRLRVTDRGLFFRADGQARGKIGVSPRRARPVLGSWNPEAGVLTLVQYDQPPQTRDYVNSTWEWQAEPLAGDAVNSYNDGPPAPGVPPLGPFYELETSSPAAALIPDESLTHSHRTFHFQGPDADLDVLARATLGTGLRAMENAWNDPGTGA